MGSLNRKNVWLWVSLVALISCAGGVFAAGQPAGEVGSFPPPLESYNDAQFTSLWEVLKHRVEVEPFNLWATILFIGAVLHTFLTQKFRHWAHVLDEKHKTKKVESASVSAQAMHFLGEVEAVFGIWVAPLVLLMMLKVGPDAMLNYIDHRVGYHEPIFVVVIMAISATRPILTLAETMMRRVAAVGGG